MDICEIDYMHGLTTVTQYEKLMLCNYLIALVELFETDGKFLDFCYALDKILEINNDKFSQIISKSTFSYDELSKFKPELKEILIQKSKKLKYKSSKIEDKITLVSDLYGLNKVEQEFLKYYILETITPCIKQIGYLIGYPDKFGVIGVFLLNLKSWAANKIRKQMVKKGIFIKQGPVEYNIFLNPKILEIFENPDIRTKTQIKTILLGKNQKSELNWKDFDHLDKERDITLNILTSAIENNTKGINILLYGTVGTGKTQFAKVIANKAKIDMYAVSAEFMDKEASRKDRLSDFASKQTVLSRVEKSCILFDEAEDVMNRGFIDFGSASKAYLNNLIEDTPVPIFWTTNNIYDVDPAFLRRMTYSIPFEKLTDEIRLNIWKRVIRKNKFKVDNKKLVELNNNYDIPPSLIANAVETTKMINGTQDDFEVFVENVAQVMTKKKNVKKKKEFEMKDYDDKLVNTDLDIKDLPPNIVEDV